jgi:hypothetical protein
VAQHSQIGNMWFGSRIRAFGPRAAQAKSTMCAVRQANACIPHTDNNIHCQGSVATLLIALSLQRNTCIHRSRLQLMLPCAPLRQQASTFCASLEGHTFVFVSLTPPAPYLPVKGHILWSIPADKRAHTGYHTSCGVVLVLPVDKAFAVELHLCHKPSRDIA